MQIDNFETGRLMALAGQPLPAGADEEMARGYRNGTLEKQVRDTNPRADAPVDRYAD